MLRRTVFPGIGSLSIEMMSYLRSGNIVTAVYVDGGCMLSVCAVVVSLLSVLSYSPASSKQFWNLLTDMGQKNSTLYERTPLQQTNEKNEIQRKSLNFLLVGKTGHGKSSVGNSILRCQFFDTRADTSSVTQEVDCGYSEFGSYLLKVVDGPGLEDTHYIRIEDTESAIKNNSKAITMCHEGVDAFLFVFRFGNRFTSEEVSALDTLKGIFGKEYLKHVIVVITGGDEFTDVMEEEDFNGTFVDWCKKQPEPFRQLYKVCQRRCVLFNNLETDEERKIAQIEQLIQLTHDLKSRQGRYTAECFERAAAERERMVIKLKEPILKEHIQQQAGLVFTKMQQYYEQPTPIKRVEIEEAIQKLKQAVNMEDKGHGLLKDLMKIVLDVERNLHDIDQLPVLVKRLEDTRKAAIAWRLVDGVTNIVGSIFLLGLPLVGLVILLGTCSVVGIGKLVIKVVEHVTENKIVEIDKKMTPTETTTP